jgi:D-alanine-D-alanine ligase
MPTQELVRRVSEECGWPAVVKPNGQGSSVGVSIVQEPEALPEAVDRAAAYDTRLLFETFIPGREMTVAVLEGKALSVVEIVPHGGLYDYRSKYTQGTSSYHVPAEIPDATARCMQAHAERCFEALRCRDFARIDFRLSPSLEPYCLEVNSIPGMTPASLVPKAAQARGIDFDTLVETITRAAAARGRVRSG